MGRYITSDPIGLDGGLNTFGYVGGNPLVYADPTGEFAAQLGGAAISAGIDIFIQLATNGLRFECIKWDVVAIAAVAGAFNPFSAAKGVGSLLKGEISSARASNLRRGSKAAQRKNAKAASKAESQAKRGYKFGKKELIGYGLIEGFAEGLGNLIPDDQHIRLKNDECGEPCK